MMVSFIETPTSSTRNDLVYRDIVIADRPQGYWRLGEGSGTHQNSGLGSQVMTWTTGTPTYAVEGKYGRAVRVSGAQIATAPTVSDFYYSTGSLEAWFKGASPGASYRGIIAKRLAWGLYIKDGVVISYNMGGGADQSTGINVADGNWHHLVLTFEPGSAAIYVDGVKTSFGAHSVLSNDEKMVIGAGYESSTGQSITGDIDEAAIYDYRLTDAQVASHYYAGSPTAWDSFKRADSATTMGTSDSGHVWVPQSGTWGISSNQGYNVAPNQAIAGVDAGYSNVRMECDLSYTGATMDSGFAFRIADNNNYLLVATYQNGVRLWRKKAGTFTELGTQTFITISSNVSHHWEISVVEDTIQVALNGAVIRREVMSVENYFYYAPNTKHGIREHNNNGERWDNLTLTRIAGHEELSWTPAQMANLAMWLPNPDYVPLTPNASVAAWEDASGNARYPVQTDANEKPTYVTNVRNGRGAILFDHDALIYSGLAVTPPGDYSIYAVTNGVADASAGTYLGQRDTSGTPLYPTFGVLAGNGHPVQYHRTDGGTLTQVEGGTSVAGEWHIVSCTKSGTTATLYVDGIQADQETIGGTQTYSPTSVYIGGNGSSSGHGAVDLMGHLSEVVVFSEAHDASERLQVHNFLSSEYAIPVA